MKAGAHDYLMKDNLARLGEAVRRELQEAENRRQGRRIQREKEEAYARLAHLNNVLEAIRNVNQLIVR